MSSPIFKSQRRALAQANVPRPKKLVIPSLNPPVCSSFMKDDKDALQDDDDEDCSKLSPILWSQRALGKTQQTQDATPWKKLRVDENHITKELMRAAQTPTQIAGLHDDSFVESINFEEIDSMCLSMESTPKRKVRNTAAKRMSSSKKMVTYGYSLRHTPQRANTLLRQCGSSSALSKDKINVSGRDSEQTPPRHKRNSHSSGHKGKSVSLTTKYLNQSFYGEIGMVEESSCSSSGSNEEVCVSRGVNLGHIKKKSVAHSHSQGDNKGRMSPDLFGEASGHEQEKERLSESMDAVLALIEDSYYNNSSDVRDALPHTSEHQSDHPSGHHLLSRVGHPPLHSLSQNLQKSTRDTVSRTSRDPQPQSNPCDLPSVQPSPRYQSILKCQDSQLSFSSTLESQPLIERLENKLKEASTSQVGGEVVQPVTERRAAALAAALDQSAQTHTAGQDLLHLGPFYGLPSSVARLLKEHRGISQLYEWQEECIRAGSDGSNLLICQPTSGGKTLVAEIIILQHILLRRRHAIFVLPYVALVQEKVRGLSIFGVELGFLVEEYAGSRGSFPPKQRKNKHVVYVATIEKAGGLVNWMVEGGGGRSGGVGVVVVDEVHMLAEQGGRGASLESTLTKLRFAATDVQVVGMSATVGNLKELAQFLGATLHHGTFRPVTLTEHIKVGGDLWEVNAVARTDDDILRNHRISCFPYSEEQLGYDKDQVGGLVGEVVPQHSCLVFCPTRRSCEAVAEMLCRVLSKELKQFRHSEKVSLYRTLVEEGGGSVCPILRKTIPFGVAYHHSGVTEGEKKALEEGYLAGTLCCLCCTSTLAAGVNLPARRVIIRAPYTGREFLTRARYKQMVGRAGRAGLDTSGESFLILQPQQLFQARSLLVSEIEECRSTLEQDGERGLTSLVFSSVALSVAPSLPCLTRLAHTALWALQASRNPTSTIDVNAKVRELVERLRKKGLVRVKLENELHSPAKQDKDSHCPVQRTPENVSGVGEESPGSTSCLPALHSLDKNVAQALAHPVADSDVLTVSRLGHAAIKGNVDLDLAGRLYTDLCVARENLAVNSHLHLLYLVTPYQPLSSTPLVPDVLYAAYMALGEEELKVARLLGISEGVVVKLRIGHKSKVDWGVVERFYVALLLHQVWSGAGIWEASNTFHVHRGFTQQTLTAAAAFASSVYHFCQELKELWAFRDLLANFTQQLSACCSAELLPLMDLPAVKRGRARQLYQAGYQTLQDVARADVGHLVKSIDHLSFKMATQLVNSAKMLLLERAETLQVETEEVMLGLRGPIPTSPQNTDTTKQTLANL
ncbi:hypothetical protein Pmani_018339 [Petrolisthes manimaculis]|uniref:Helicase POLQ-like n=1 Tax=Petrolisthes manimaculis TaxID=1843537 RepID=A0AAE1PJY4_9EUCA|nr:hypothetical protein Pmani_018339 [Petrolisthes manimaculis]